MYYLRDLCDVQKTPLIHAKCYFESFKFFLAFFINYLNYLCLLHLYQIIVNISNDFFCIKVLIGLRWIVLLCHLTSLFNHIKKHSITGRTFYGHYLLIKSFHHLVLSHRNFGYYWGIATIKLLQLNDTFAIKIN